MFTDRCQHTTTPTITRPRIVLLTDDSKDKVNHNSTTYCVYWRTTTKLNSTIIRPRIVFTDRCQHTTKPTITRPRIALLTDDNKDTPNLITTTCCVYWPTTTTTNPSIIRPHTMFTDGRQQWQIQPYCDRILCLLTDNNKDKSNLITTTSCVYWPTTTTTNPTIIRPYIVLLTDDNKNKSNLITTTCCVYWLTTKTTNPIIIRAYIVFSDERKQQ